MSTDFFMNGISCEAADIPGMICREQRASKVALGPDEHDFWHYQGFLDKPSLPGGLKTGKRVKASLTSFLARL
jgi:hypothetical protein